MKTSEFPTLFQTADAEAIRLQRLHMNYLTWTLLGLICGEAFSIASSAGGWANRTAAVIGAVFFILTLALSILMSVRSFDQRWYAFRALAESVKTQTWRYVMRSEPYQVDDQTAGTLFIEKMQEMLNENRVSAEKLPAVHGDAVSTTMDQIRSLPFQDRKAVYKRDRIDDQHGWYIAKANWNRSKYSTWFLWMVILQGVALSLVIYKIVTPQANLLPTGLMTTSAGAILTWIQAKRFSELSASYNLTALEIGIVKSKVDRLTEGEFSDFVRDAEAAFSREHTQWAARRRN